MPSSLKLYQWKELKISAFGLNKTHAINQALIGVIDTKVDEVRKQLESIEPEVKQSNLRK